MDGGCGFLAEAGRHTFTLARQHDNMLLSLVFFSLCTTKCQLRHGVSRLMGPKNQPYSNEIAVF